MLGRYTARKGKLFSQYGQVEWVEEMGLTPGTLGRQANIGLARHLAKDTREQT